MKIEFCIPGRPYPKERPRTTWRKGKVITYTPEKTRTFSDSARAIAYNACQKKKFLPIPYPTPVKVEFRFTITRMVTSTPDLVNLAAATCDVLQGITYDNDSQVVEMHITKVKGKYPMTEVVVESVD